MQSMGGIQRSALAKSSRGFGRSAMSVILVKSWFGFVERSDGNADMVALWSSYC